MLFQHTPKYDKGMRKTCSHIPSPFTNGRYQEFMAPFTSITWPLT